MTMTLENTALADALVALEQKKAGLLPPFLTRAELDDLLAAWWRLYRHPKVTLDNNRFIADHRLYQEPAFAALATHPVVQDAARRVIGDFKLASYSIVATPKNGDTPAPTEELGIHVDHCVYSDVPVPKARDTFVCVWVNFEDLSLENGPFCIFTGTDAWNIGWEFFNNGLRPGLRPRDLQMHHLAEYNVGPAGSTAVYSGKTWHSGTVNCRDELRKGMVINFVPAIPQDCSSQNFFDACALPLADYTALADLIDIPDYLLPHRPDLVGMTPATHLARKQAKKANDAYDELA